MSRVVMIGCCVSVPRSHWLAVPTPLFDNIMFFLGTHFLYLSNPPSVNLLPILPWKESFDEMYVLMYEVPISVNHAKIHNAKCKAIIFHATPWL